MTSRELPLRTLKAPIHPPDSFTVEQARAAVLAVMAERGETPVWDVIEQVKPFRRSHRSRGKFRIRCPARRKP